MHKHVREQPPSPLAGVDISAFPSTQSPYRLLTVRAKLVTSATVANRTPHFQFVTPSGDVFFEAVPSAAQTEGATVIYQLTADSGAPNEGSAVNDGIAGLSLPNFWVEEGTRVKTATTNIEAGDQWSSIYVTYLVRDALAWRELVADVVDSAS